MVAGDRSYHGIDPAELIINDVDWSERGQYIQKRSIRRPGDFDVHPEWATEAIFDEERLVAPDPASKNGLGLRVIGYSASADRVLTVILIPKDIETISEGSWWGVNAWASNSTDMRRYYSSEI